MSEFVFEYSQAIVVGALAGHLIGPFVAYVYRRFNL